MSMLPCSLINKPLVLRTRSIGAEVAGVQKISSNSTCKSANPALFPSLFYSVMVCGCHWFATLRERQCLTHTAILAISYNDCFKNAQSP